MYFVAQMTSMRMVIAAPVSILTYCPDWPAVMKALDDIGYKGWACAEIGGGDAKRLQKIAELMDRIIAS